MKNFEKNLKQVKPQASKDFKNRLETNLMERANGMERYQRRGFFNFRFVRGLSLASVVGLVILAIFVSTVSPTALSKEEFIARASEYYSENDGQYQIFYEKATIDSGVGKFGISVSEIWSDSLGNEYIVNGGYLENCVYPDCVEVKNAWNESHWLTTIDEESGIISIYIDSESAINSMKLIDENPYCVLRKTDNAENSIMAFEVNNIEVGALTLMGGGMIIPKIEPEKDFPRIYTDASSGFRKGKILFDYYETHADSIDYRVEQENGENLYVFTKGDFDKGAKFGEMEKLEAGFNDNYELVREKIFYRNGQVTTRKFEHKIVDKPKEEVFDPDLRDLELVTKQHKSIDENTEPGCYHFNSERMSPEETKEALEKIPEDWLQGFDKNIL